MSRTAVVLVNTNGLQDTTRCIRSLIASDTMPVLVVIDNGSTENGLAETVSSYPRGHLVKLEENVGFGRANNVGIRWALNVTTCKYVFVLNNDTVVEPDLISRLEHHMDENPSLGVLSPRIVMLDDATVLWYAGGDIDWRKGAPHVRGYMGPADTEFALADRDVSFASGCAMFVRRQVWRDVGGFDPRYFIYEEDTELCLRVRDAGWRIGYVADAVLHHKAHGSRRKDGEKFLPRQHPRNKNLPFFMYQITKNRLLTMWEHARGRKALQFWSFFPLYWSAYCIRYLAAGRFDAVAEVARGARDFWRQRNMGFEDELAGSAIPALTVGKARHVASTRQP